MWYLCQRVVVYNCLEMGNGSFVSCNVRVENGALTHVIQHVVQGRAVWNRWPVEGTSQYATQHNTAQSHVSKHRSSLSLCVCLCLSLCVSVWLASCAHH